MRSAFLTYKSASGSNVDQDKKFYVIEDVFLYLPRAIQVGFLSPFPGYWVSEGQQTGYIGRIISGIETLLMYLVFLGFLWALLTHRKIFYALIPILIFSVIIITLLGLAVPNIGAIYRMRQGLFIPIYMVGVYGLFLISYYKEKGND